MPHLNIRVYGDVQGVFFRDSAKKKADEFGVTGFARNDADGTVYMEAEGEEPALKDFVEWCREGPSSAAVVRVDVTEDEMQNHNYFDAV